VLFGASIFLRANCLRHGSLTPTDRVSAGQLPSSPIDAVEIACPKVQAAHR